LSFSIIFHLSFFMGNGNRQDAKIAEFAKK